MPAPRKYDQETRDRAVRMYQERRRAHPGESAIECRRRIGALIDVHSETLRGWIERVEVDAGARPGTTTDEHAELIRLRREVGELRRAEATWQERALNAEHELKRAHDEIGLQRTRIGEQLGRIRDLENDLPADGVQQLLTETHSLKARVRQLSEDNSRLQERLTGARDNNRFLDKRIADLEAELADHVTLTAHGRARPNGLAE